METTQWTHRIISKPLKRHLKNPALWFKPANAKPDHANTTVLFVSLFRMKYTVQKSGSVQLYCRGQQEHAKQMMHFSTGFIRGIPQVLSLWLGTSPPWYGSFTFNFFLVLLVLLPYSLLAEQTGQSQSKAFLKKKKKAEELLLTFMSKVRCKTLQIWIKHFKEDKNQTDTLYSPLRSKTNLSLLVGWHGPSSDDKQSF